jgi:hypothetical protein
MSRPPFVYPPITNSRDRLILILRHAPERAPGLVNAIEALCNQALESLGSYGRDQIRESGVEPRGLPDGIGKLGQHLPREQVSLLGELLAHHVPAAEDHHVLPPRRFGAR